MRSPGSNLCGRCAQKGAADPRSSAACFDGGQGLRERGARYDRMEGKKKGERSGFDDVDSKCHRAALEAPASRAFEIPGLRASRRSPLTWFPMR